MTETVIVTVYGAPRTKKNSQKITYRNGKFGLQQSDAYRKWERTCKVEYIQPIHTRKQNPIDYPVNCQAIFYRERNIGDAVNFYQGIADLLEKHDVLVDDKHITSWVGSELLKDKDNPRVEITLIESTEFFKDYIRSIMLNLNSQVG